MCNLGSSFFLVVYICLATQTKVRKLQNKLNKNSKQVVIIAMLYGFLVLLNITK